MIELTDKTVALWFVSLTPESDYLAAISELIPDAKYELTYRFRYYRDEKAFDSDDRKSWWHGELSGTRHYVLGSFRMVVTTLAAASGGKMYEYVNDGDIEEFKKKLADAPFMFMRRESKRNQGGT